MLHTIVASSFIGRSPNGCSPCWRMRSRCQPSYFDGRARDHPVFGASSCNAFRLFVRVDLTYFRAGEGVTKSPQPLLFEFSKKNLTSRDFNKSEHKFSKNWNLNCFLNPDKNFIFINFIEKLLVNIISLKILYLKF